MIATGEVIRELCSDDREPLSRLFRQNDVPEVTRVFHPFPLDAASAEMIVSEKSRDVFFGAFLEDKMLGLGMLRGWAQGYEIPSLGLLVDSGHQQDGIGRRLAKYGIAEAKRRGSSRLRLTVYANNKPAVTLFRSLGFNETQRESIARGETVGERLEMMLDLRPDGRQG